MIIYTAKDRALTFLVLVSPRAVRSEIVGEHDGLLRVRIAAAPVEGAANAELVSALAECFGVPKSAIDITAGMSSKLKQVHITGSVRELIETLQALAMRKR